MVTLKELRPGDRARVTAIQAGTPLYRHKLLSLGIIPGVQLQVIRRAPLGCPIEIEAQGCRISLRQFEADILHLEKIA